MTTNKRQFTIIIIEILVFIISILIDQSVKMLTEIYVPVGQAAPIVRGVIDFTFAKNFGAAFSLFSGSYWPLLFVRTIMSLAIVYILITRHTEYSVLLRISLILILSGAAGNLIDQIFIGYVRDMFEFTFVRFAIFNVADIFITFGVLLLCGFVLFSKKAENSSKGNVS